MDLQSNDNLSGDFDEGSGNNEPVICLLNSFADVARLKGAAAMFGAGYAV